MSEPISLLDFPPLQPSPSSPPHPSLPSTTPHPPPLMGEPASAIPSPAIASPARPGASPARPGAPARPPSSPPRPSILSTCSAPASASPAKLGLELPARPAFSEQARPSPSLLGQPSSSPPLSPPPSTAHHLLSPLGESKVDSFSAPLGALSVPNSTAFGLGGARSRAPFSFQFFDDVAAPSPTVIAANSLVSAGHVSAGKTAINGAAAPSSSVVDMAQHLRNQNELKLIREQLRVLKGKELANFQRGAKGEARKNNKTNIAMGLYDARKVLDKKS